MYHTDPLLTGPGEKRIINYLNINDYFEELHVHIMMQCMHAPSIIETTLCSPSFNTVYMYSCCIFMCVWIHLCTCAQYLKHTLTSSREVLLQRRVAKR